MKKKLILTISSAWAAIICPAQDTTASRTLEYDPDKLKVIPDKVFEIGIPFLLIFLLLNTIVSIIKIRSETRLKEKMIEKGVSEESLIKIFKESNAIARLQPLKWFLFTVALALSLLLIHVLHQYLINQSGYLAIAIILLFLSAAFIVYYKMLVKKI